MIILSIVLKYTLITTNMSFFKNCFLNFVITNDFFQVTGNVLFFQVSCYTTVTVTGHCMTCDSWINLAYQFRISNETDGIVDCKLVNWSRAYLYYISPFCDHCSDSKWRNHYLISKWKQRKYLFYWNGIFWIISVTPKVMCWNLFSIVRHVQSLWEVSFLRVQHSWKALMFL